MEAAAEKDSMGTQAMGSSQWHPGLQPVGSCFIGGAGDHTAAVGVSTDHHRLASKGRVKHLLHRDKESVEVDMKDAASHFPSSIKFFIENICSNIL
jgi:hypothetical protein